MDKMTNKLEWTRDVPTQEGLYYVGWIREYSITEKWNTSLVLIELTYKDDKKLYIHFFDHEDWEPLEDYISPKDYLEHNYGHWWAGPIDIPDSPQKPEGWTK